MHLATALAIAAFASSLLLLIQLKARLFPIIAAIVSGIELLLAFHILHFSLRGLNLMLVFGAALLVAGAIIWARTGGKTHITAATVIALVGAIQIATVLL